MLTTVICTDFDGTLMDEQGDIHPRDIEILSMERRVAFVLATARLLPAIRTALQRNDLFVDASIALPLVLQNGAALYGPGETLQRYDTFAASMQSALIDAMFAHPEVTFFLYALNEVHVLWPTEVTLAIGRRYGLYPQPFSPESRTQRFSKVACVAETHAPLQVFAGEIAHLDAELAFSVEHALEVNQKGVNKGRGLATLISELHLEVDKIVVAGDGGNDVPLFDMADLSFAPETAQPAVRARADYVMDVCDQGLLTPILRKIGLY